MLGHLSEEEKARLRKIVEEGVSTKTEIQTLNDGLRETINAVAKELDIKPSHIRGAIQARFKSNLDEEKENVEIIEEILDLTK